MDVVVEEVVVVVVVGTVGDGEEEMVRKGWWGREMLRKGDIEERGC